MSQSKDQARLDPGKGSAASVLAVLAIALTLRIYQLGTESLWIDEGYSIRDASADLGLYEARPLYFKLLHWWMQFGTSEAWLRMPSVVFGVLTVLMVYLIGRRLFGHTPGLVAALITAVSPLHVNHSQEIRMYSLLTALVTMSVLLFLRYVETGRLRTLIGVLAFSFASFLVFPLSVFMFAVYSVYLLFHIRRHRKPAVWWLTGQAAMAVAAVPWMPKLLEVSKEFGDAWTWRLAKPGPIDIAWMIRDFNLWRIASSHKTALMVSNAYTFVILGLLLFGALYGLGRAGWQTRFTLLWLLVPLAGTAIVSNVSANMWITRYLIYASPALYLLIGLGLTRLAGSRAAYSIALIGVLGLPLARLAVYYQQPEHPEWRQAVRWLQQNADENDSIAIYRSGNKHAFHYYYRGKTPVVALGPEGLTRQSFQGWTDARVASLLAEIPSTSRRVWFVFSWHEEAGGVQIEDYVRRHYDVVRLTEFERIRIFEARPKESTEPALLTRK